MNKNLTKVLASLTIAAGAGMFTACGDSDKAAGITVEDAGIADNNISSSSEDEGGESSSSSSKKDNSSSSEEVKVFSGKISGVSQKGPFLVGSTITLHEIDDETFGTSGRSFPDKIKNDKGEFEISYKELSSNYALLIADGYYRNENTGNKSTSPIKLNALSDLSDRSTVNVNLLTHLEYDRVIYLINEKGMEYKEAKAQAEKEILAAFGISEIKDANAEDLSIFGSTENDRALLALSVLMQGSASEGEFSERLALIAQDLEKDGSIDGKQILANIADEAYSLDLKNTRQNILDWKIASDIPDFEGIVTNFWNVTYGIGNCTAEKLGTSATIENERSKNFGTTFVCDVDGWREITPNEVKYGNCSAAEEGNRFEDVLVCHDGEWKNLEPEERVGECTKELYGNVLKYENEASTYNKNQFVCDVDGWRKMSYEETVTGACTIGEKDQGKTYAYPKQNVYLVCQNGQWNSITQSEYEKLSIDCTEEGKIVKSEINDSYYICKDGKITTPSFEDFVTDKTIEADHFNGTAGVYGPLDSSIVIMDGEEMRTVAILAFGRDEEPTHSVMYYTDGTEINNTYFLKYSDKYIPEMFLADKGIKYTYEFKEGTTYANAQVGFEGRYPNGEKVTEFEEWGGICVVYASTTSMELTITASSANSYKTNFARLPASMELTVANFKWEELNQNPSTWSIDPLEAIKDMNSISIGPSRSKSTQSYSAETGAVYIAAIGGYNSCSIK